MLRKKLLNRPEYLSRRSGFRGRLRSRFNLLLCVAAGGSLLVVMLVAFSRGRSIEQSLTHAREAWDSGDYQVAADEYERYLQSNATGGLASEIKLQLANIYFLNLHRYDRARMYYQEFLDEAPSHPGAYNARERLAELLGETGRSYEAIAEYENLSPQEPAERRRIRLRIADLYYDQKNYSQALTEYDKVTENVAYDELCEQAYLREASVYHLARHQFQQALRVYQKLASQTSDAKVRRRALLGMSDCYAGLYQFDQAIHLLRDLKDPAEQPYVARRVSELEQQKRDVSRIPEVRWTRKTTVKEAEEKQKAESSKQ